MATHTTKQGRHHWIYQRLTALGLVATVGIFAFNGDQLTTSYNSLALWLQSPQGGIPAMVFVVSLFWHSHLGVMNVVEDYIRKRFYKVAIRYISLFYNTLAAILCLGVLLEI